MLDTMAPKRVPGASRGYASSPLPTAGRGATAHASTPPTGPFHGGPHAHEESLQKQAEATPARLTQETVGSNRLPGAGPRTTPENHSTCGTGRRRSRLRSRLSSPQPQATRGPRDLRGAEWASGPQLLNSFNSDAWSFKQPPVARDSIALRTRHPGATPGAGYPGRERTSSMLPGKTKLFSDVLIADTPAGTCDGAQSLAPDAALRCDRVPATLKHGALGPSLRTGTRAHTRAQQLGLSVLARGPAVTTA